jgi:hypothetical protein
MNETEDKPFTDNLATDIVLLSSFLSSQEQIGLSQPQAKKNQNLNLLSHISTLLTTGTLSSANAVVGSIESTSIQCLVFTDSTSRTYPSQQQMLNPSVANFRGPQSWSLSSIVPNSARGAELLNRWSEVNW